MENTGSLSGVLVASDRDRDRHLLEVSIQEIIKAFDLAAKGDVDDAISITYNDKKQDYVVRTLKRTQRSTTISK